MRRTRRFSRLQIPVLVLLCCLATPSWSQVTEIDDLTDAATPHSFSLFLGEGAGEHPQRGRSQNALGGGETDATGATK